MGLRSYKCLRWVKSCGTRVLLTLSPKPHMRARTGCCTTTNENRKPSRTTDIVFAVWETGAACIACPFACIDTCRLCSY